MEANDRLVRRIELPTKGDYPMATERLKFRCYRCNQLLAVAPSKAGTVVACPKCQADLLIPGGEPRAKGNGENRARAEVESRPRRRPSPRPAERPYHGPRPKRPPSWAQARCRPSHAPVPGFLGQFAGVIPPDLADLRPEDLRVEAEFFESLTRVPEPAPTVDPAPWPVTESLTTSFSPEPVSASAPWPPAVHTPSEPERTESFSVPPEPADLVPAAVGEALPTRRGQPDRPSDRDRAAHHPPARHRNSSRQRGCLARVGRAGVVPVRLGRHRAVVRRGLDDGAFPLEDALKRGNSTRNWQLATGAAPCVPTRSSEGDARAAHRSLLRATGVGEGDWNKPFIAICNSHVDIIPGHVHLQAVGNYVKDACGRPAACRSCSTRSASTTASPWATTG